MSGLSLTLLGSFRAALDNVDDTQLQKLSDGIQSHVHPGLLICHGCRRDLEQAIKLYEDEFIAGSYLETSNEYEDYTQIKRKVYLWYWKVLRPGLALILALLLSLFFTGLAHAHGGEGDELHGGPAPVWMIGLIYLQLFMIPIVAIWLARETIGAWLHPAGQPDNQGGQHDPLG